MTQYPGRPTLNIHDIIYINSKERNVGIAEKAHETQDPEDLRSTFCVARLEHKTGGRILHVS